MHSECDLIKSLKDHSSMNQKTFQNESLADCWVGRLVKAQLCHDVYELVPQAKVCATVQLSK
jgi:hypothetical protein